MVDPDQTDTKWGVVRVYTITPDKTKKYLGEALLMSTHNICFHEEIY